MQTEQTQFRRHKTRRLIRIYTVCLDEFVCKIRKSAKYSLEIPRTSNGHSQNIRMDKPIGQNGVKVSARISQIAPANYRR